MHPFQRRPFHKVQSVWQWLFCLTILSFLCRAIIPVGYMPDSSGGHNGTSPIAIALCAVGGSTNTILLDLNGQTDPSSSDNHFNQQDCLFCLVVSQAMMPSQDAPALAGDIVPHSIQRPYRNQALPPLPALGPPLGSRAPPSNFG